MPPEAAARTHSTSAAFRSDSPRATSRCEVWSRPPCDTGRPWNLRVTVTSVVSMIGISSNSTGMASTASTFRRSPSEAPTWFETRVRPPRKNPRNSDPQSPMKMDAGLKLKNRNATTAPRKRSGQRGGLELSRGVAEVHQVGRGDGRHAAGQAVQVVQQVDRVGDAHQPEHGQRLVQHRRFQPVQPGPEQREGRRKHDLPDQLAVGLQLNEIVEQAQTEHPGRTQQQQLVARKIWRPVGKHHRRETGEDAHPAEQGGRPAVPAVGPGLGHQPEAARERPHQVHQGQGRPQGHARSRWRSP